MCGIAGLVSFRPVEDIAQRVAKMTRVLHRRGPDAEGLWIDAAQQVALGHRRLSILDPDARSNQPMISRDERYVISYNGEIYNHTEIRRSLRIQGQSFRTSSDTETLLEAISCWGVVEALRLIEGMFAFALWDSVARRIYLCRDRFGIKPCYWTWQNGVLAFSSELKSLMEQRQLQFHLNAAAVNHVLDFSFAPSPDSILREVRQLEPGQLLRLDEGGCPIVDVYWRLDEAKQHQVGSLAHRSDAELRGELNQLLNDAVRRYLYADAPLGCFLSGGIDSSLVTAVAMRHSPSKLKTFSLGYAERQWDESSKAKAIATYLGSEHNELILSDGDALEFAESIPEHYDEPFADFSQLPTLALCQFARQQVTVCLSGDGGDELFGGYTRYGWSQDFWHLLSAFPDPIRTEIFSRLERDRIELRPDEGLPQTLQTLLTELPKCLPFGKRINSFRDLYARIMRVGVGSLFDGPNDSCVDEMLFWSDDTALSLTDRMQLADIRRYMGDGILTKVDRASMSVGLEVRIPLLSEDVVQYAFGLPERSKRSNGGIRGLQRSLAYEYVPQPLLDQPKMGFGFPIDVWLRSSLRDWASDLLSENSLKSVPYLRRDVVAVLWSNHCSGRSNEHWRLWPVLMFVQWHRRWARHLTDV